MANPIKGEVEFEQGGKLYTFVLGFLALADLEEKSGKPFSKLIEQLQQEQRIGDLIAVFQAGLKRHNRNLTREEVADLMDDLGIERINAILGDAVRLMSAGRGGGEQAGGEGRENPTVRPGNGSGAKSSAPIGSG